jgi:hypothetical protein
MSHIKKRLIVRLGKKLNLMRKSVKQLDIIMTKKSYNLRDFTNLFKIREI